MKVPPPSLRHSIKSPNAPAAIGPYSQGVLAGNMLFCSGQISLDPVSGEMIRGEIEEEATQVLDNLGAVLRAGGLDFQHAVQCTVFLTSLDDYAPVNEVYARYFCEAPPARETIQVAALPRGARVEISCIAVR
ncbi:MAG: RidA family protein [Bacteroidetes bacterium]|nr:RidA family protein [Bacteroidota bacterium]